MTAEKTCGTCRACRIVAPLDQLRPVVGRADLGTLLAGALLCIDALADECRARGRGNRRGYVFVAVELAETWAAGNVLVVTDDPRRAEEHAAALNGVSAQWLIHSDYRKH